MDYALGDKPTALHMLDAAMREALGERITGLTHDADGVRVHFVGEATAAERATADAVFAAHNPESEPPAPTEEEQWAAMEAQIEAATTMAQIKAAMLKMAKLKSGRG